jgi:hypothetical protein
VKGRASHLRAMHAESERVNTHHKLTHLRTRTGKSASIVRMNICTCAHTQTLTSRSAA